MAEKLYYDSSSSKLNSAIETDPTIATPSNVKEDYLFKDASTQEPLVGTMPINASSTIKIDPETDTTNNYYYTIPKGYHSGTGKVYVGKLSEYTQATATVDVVGYGKTFWANGERLVGTLNIESVKQEGTATATDIVKDMTAWVKGVKITGTIPNLPRKDKTLLAGESYTIPYGVSAGTSIVSAASLASQTTGTATASDVAKSKIAWVNGEKVTGTLDVQAKIQEILKDTNVLKSQVLQGKMFYSITEGIASGTMPDHTGEGGRTINIGSTYYIPEGYYNGLSYIKTLSLAEVTEGTAKASEILIDRTAWVDGVKVTGTMASNISYTTEIDAGSTYTIPVGYHTGNGKVVAKSIEKQTIATATADDILADKTAWVNGVKVVGTMPNNQSTSVELGLDSVYYIPKGFHNNTSNVWTRSLSYYTPATATSDDVLINKTAWVKGSQITGTMVENESSITTLSAGEQYIIPSGHHTGTGKVKAKDLDSQTEGTAAAADIVYSKTAWVNGVKVTGSLELTGTANKTHVLKGYTFYNTSTTDKLVGDLELTGNVSEEDVVAGKKFYSTDPLRIQTGTLILKGTADSNKVLAGYSYYSTNPKYMESGSMVNNGQVSVEIESGSSYTIPEGYHNGSGTVRASGLGPQTEGTAEATDIIKDKTAWVNGTKLTGTLELDGNVVPEYVVSGYTYYTDNPKLKLTGTMPTIIPAITTIKASEEYTISKGYHDGTGKVVGKSLASQTEGDAEAENIINTKIAWVDGVKITGTMPVNTAEQKTLLASESYAIAKGYHDGTGTVTAQDLTSQTISDAIAADILDSKTAWVNGVKITGSMAINAAEEKILEASESYTIPKGYHDGTGKVTSKDIASQTAGTATAGDVIADKTAWVNGAKITGTIPTQTTTVLRLAAGHSTTLEAGYYPEGVTVYAIYTDRLDLNGTDAYNTDNVLYTNTSGYVDGNEFIETAEVKTL